MAKIKETPKAEEYVDQETGEVFDQIPEGLEASLVDEQVGFPPYWTPAEGKKLYCRPISIDMRDPKFNRFVCLALHETTCQTGPADDDEKVTVPQGEYFTMSVYAALPLDQFFGEDVLITVVRKRELKSTGNDLWVFTAKVSKEAKARLQARRVEDAKKMGAAAATARMGVKAPLSKQAETLPVT